MSQQLTSQTLRSVADALDRLAETTTTTGFALCAYGREDVEVDGVTLSLARADDTVRYVIDLTSE